MLVLIAGGGRTGAQLATMLVNHPSGHQVRLIEHRAAVLPHLHRELPTEAIVEGNATSPPVLEHAGIRQADVLVACTSQDADNLVLCFLARSMFNVPRTIARINNPRNAWLFDNKFHVDVALDQADLMAHLIAEEMSLGDMMTLLKLRKGQYSLVEEKVDPAAPAVDQAVRDLGLPAECVLTAVIREGQLLIPRGDTVLQAGDQVLAVVHAEQLAQLAALLGPPSAGPPSAAPPPEAE
ncbi:MAG: NAD-binding protein [Chloroflexi bacterium]|nr:NAD-binding protein [Chloroflexota bacterium]MBU1747721.1 NAD-binding protein [Chloroflexota bacterium]